MSNEDSVAQQKQTYLERNVKPILKEMMNDLLETQPENVVRFLQGWIKTKGGQFEDHTKSFEGQLPTSDEDQGEEMDSEEEAKLELARNSEARKTNKKLAVSAEAYGEYNQAREFKAKVVKKTPQQEKQIREILSKSIMFSSLDKKSFEVVMGAMEIRKFQKEQFVIRQGEDGDVLFIVAEGKLSCSKLFLGKEQETHLLDYQPGDVFGELALMYNAPRAASIKAVEDSVLFSLDRETFTAIVKRNAVTNRQKYNDFLNKVELLTTLNQYEKEKVGDCLQQERFEVGALIIKEGEEGKRFYFIMEGRAEAIKGPLDQNNVVFEYRENDYFGELALLGENKRQATIRAKTEVVVASLDTDAFRRLLGPLEPLLKRNREKYEKYQFRLNK